MRIRKNVAIWISRHSSSVLNFRFLVLRLEAKAFAFDLIVERKTSKPSYCSASFFQVHADNSDTESLKLSGQRRGRKLGTVRKLVYP